MRKYVFMRTSAGPRVYVDINGVGRPLRHIVRHSPDGFEFGYCGSGPADAALSVLTDLVGARVADMFYQDFKVAFVARSRENFVITEEEIRAWLNEKIRTRGGAS